MHNLSRAMNKTFVNVKSYVKANVKNTSNV